MNVNVKKTDRATDLSTTQIAEEMLLKVSTKIAKV